LNTSPPPQKEYYFFKIALTVGCILVASTYALSPLMGAWFHLDDFWMLTISNHTNNVSSFWLEDHSKFYFYRPLGMSLWWYLTQNFGHQPTFHYAFNIGLHILVAIGFALWVAEICRSRPLVLFAFSAYMLHPIAVRTAAWLSDRFDLLATAAVFFSLHAFLRGTNSWRWKLWFLVCSAAAFTSKESGLALLVVLVAHYIARRQHNDHRLSSQLSVVITAYAMAATYLAVRQRLLTFNGLVVAETDVSTTLLVGAKAYITTFATALLGVQDYVPPHLLNVPLLLLIVIVGVLMTRYRHTDPRAVEAFFVGVALLTACLLIHANIAGYNLNLERVRYEITSARLFHLAFGGLFVLIAVPVAVLVGQHKQVPRRIAIAISVIALAGWTVSSHRYAQRWTDETQGNVKSVIAEAVLNVEALVVPDRCIVQFLGVSTLYRAFGDTSDQMIKAFLDRKSPAMRCVFITERSPFLVITPSSDCDSKNWGPHLPVRLGIAAKPFANLCYHFFDQADNTALSNHPNLVRFQWTASKKFIRVEKTL
jgi:hypothetical protein